MDKLNPRAVVLMWGLTLLTVLAVTLGGVFIYIVGGVVVLYSLYAAFV